jgi:hypothetical protein
MINSSAKYVVCFCLMTNCSDGPSEDQATQTIEKLGGAFCRLRTGPIVEVNLDCTDATDADLQNLAGLHDLRVLSLARTKVTGDGLKIINRGTRRRASSGPVHRPPCPSRDRFSRVCGQRDVSW